jgi:hypothetical protein
VLYDESALISRHLSLIRRMREQAKLARLYGIGNEYGLVLGALSGVRGGWRELASVRWAGR